MNREFAEGREGSAPSPAVFGSVQDGRVVCGGAMRARIPVKTRTGSEALAALFEGICRPRGHTAEYPLWCHVRAESQATACLLAEEWNVGSVPLCTVTRGCSKHPPYLKDKEMATTHTLEQWEAGLSTSDLADQQALIDQIAKALHMEWDTSGTADRFEQMASDLFREFERAKMRRMGLRITCLMAMFFDESIPVHKDYYRLQDTMCYFMDRRDFRNSSGQNRLTMDALARAISSFSVPREHVFPPGSVGPDTLLVLLTSLRLEGRWKKRFAVSKGIFHRMPGEMTSETRVPTMRCTAPFRTAECAELEATLVEVPYENPHNCLVILLPTGPGGLASLEEKFSAPLVLRSIDRLRDTGEVELSLPKFCIRQVTDLTQFLPSLGVREAFTAEAQLDRLTPATDKGVQVSSVRHVATVHVSQAGARPAVPQTGLSAPGPAVARKIAVDRPFMFLVLNKKPDLVLLLGSVTTIA
ncbi:serpin B4 [Rhipicephalus sanguineus]|uniref:serpin B4 n=1 Tax=Rhipicephalus sanguineus TaxID=34632 RepID=UPI0018960F32|nr:serpin B4 [Rhipicephalus sanguineus]